MLGERSGEALACAHTLEMENREKIRLTGVSDVSGFDENVVVLMTDMGELSSRGEALHIDRIDLEAGILELRGRVNELSYEERTGGGFFLRPHFLLFLHGRTVFDRHAVL